MRDNRVVLFSIVIVTLPFRRFVAADFFFGGGALCNQYRTQQLRGATSVLHICNCCRSNRSAFAADDAAIVFALCRRRRRRPHVSMQPMLLLLFYVGLRRRLNFLFPAGVQCLPQRARRRIRCARQLVASNSLPPPCFTGPAGRAS